MPTYEYRCSGCNHTFEVFQSIVAEPIRVCPVCNEPVEQILTGGSGLIFKGSGFYITDYKKSHSSSSSDTTDKPKDKKD